MTTAFIALGGNLGDVLASFRAALTTLAERGARVGRVSSAYRTRALVPEGREPGPDYWNAVAEIDTDLEPRELLDLLLAIECDAGRDRRDRRERWGDRTLDLDLLVFGDRVVDEPGLNVPHPGLGQRPFVLQPFAEIANETPVPGMGTVGKLLGDLPAQYGGVEYVLRGWR
jgi:2-amino-4-hydroxy-6-hydroxymethyldihydropteridine diphosphokinase